MEKDQTKEDKIKWHVIVEVTKEHKRLVKSIAALEGVDVNEWVRRAVLERVVVTKAVENLREELKQGINVTEKVAKAQKALNEG